MTVVYNRPDRISQRRELRCKQTPAETIPWHHLRASRFQGYKFRRQFGIHNFIVDFYCPSVRLAIELDGDSHCSPEQIRYDAKRDNIITNLGIRILRFKNDEIYLNLENVLEKIRQALIKPFDLT